MTLKIRPFNPTDQEYEAVVEILNIHHPLRAMADHALLIDLKNFRGEGRATIDQYWAKLPAYQEWQLAVINHSSIYC